MVQYIPRNMHTVFALLCFVLVINWLIFPYPSGLLHWHCGNLTIAPVPAKQPWWIWINTSCELIMNDCITTTKQSTTKPCAYFLGYTVCVPLTVSYKWNSCLGWLCHICHRILVVSQCPCKLSTDAIWTYHNIIKSSRIVWKTRDDTQRINDDPYSKCFALSWSQTKVQINWCIRLYTIITSCWIHKTISSHLCPVECIR